MHSTTTRKGKAHYTSRDLLLYALGIGCSSNEPSEMKYLYEHDAKFSAFATFPLTLPFRASDTSNEHDDVRRKNDIGNNHDFDSSGSASFDMPPFPPPLMRPPPFMESTPNVHGDKKIGGPAIHLSQKFRVHKPIPIPTSFPSSGPMQVEITTNIVSVLPHKRGSIVITESQYHAPNGSQFQLLATSQSAVLYPQKLDSKPTRTDTMSKERHSKTAIASTLQPISFPTGRSNAKPSAVKRYSISNNQALLYRLSGDTNRIHVEGFPELFHTTQPILHGLCTLGYAVRAVLSTCTDKSINTGERECQYVECRFKKPVFVGDEIEVRMWMETDDGRSGGRGAGVESLVLFEVWNLKHGVIVVDRGVVGIGPRLCDAKKDVLTSML